VKKSFSWWVWTLVVAVVAAAPFALRYLDHYAAEAATRQGKALVNRKEYAQAIESFSRAIEIDSKYAAAYHGRGVAYLNLGQHERALPDLSEAVRLDPSDARVLYHRGVAYFRAGILNWRWRTLRKRFASARPPLTAIWRVAGSIREKGDDVHAKADRQQAVELDPTLEKSGAENP
jgi:tetratricopeptide (TPR) repeat protein